MASRRTQFLQREPWGAPKVPPAKTPPATRRPPKRDPRTTPWRPAPRKPKPGPLFPPHRRPRPTFGRRPPHVPMPATWPGQLAKLKPFLRLHPLINWGMVAWDAYQLWQLWQSWQEGGWNPEISNTVICSSRNAGAYPFEDVTWLGNPPSCVEALRASGEETWSGSRQWRVEWQGRYLPWPYDRYRWIPVRSDRFIGPSPLPPGWQPLYTPPGPVPVVRPSEVPYPYPFAPPPIPVTPPVTRPKDEPGYHPEPRPYPDPMPSPRPQPGNRPGLRPHPGLVNPIPVIEYSPGIPPKPGLHERRPPKPPEKEKKKRLKPGTSAAWLKFLGSGVGSYTEADDAITAIYKGLPWRLRRWRGKDGVWRDRDHTSVRRAMRLYQHLGELSIQDAITELVKQELTDKAFGTVGNKLKNRAKELGDEGLWSSSGGFQRGGSLQQKNWEEVYKKLKLEAAKNTPTRYYWTSEVQPDGSYRWVKRQRPMTQIPWYRQKSVYYNRRRQRTYYAPRWSLPSRIKLEP